MSKNSRAAKKLKVGDRVTWGTGAETFTVVRVYRASVSIVSDETKERQDRVPLRWKRYGTTYSMRKV